MEPSSSPKVSAFDVLMGRAPRPQSVPSHTPPVKGKPGSKGGLAASTPTSRKRKADVSSPQGRGSPAARLAALSPHGHSGPNSALQSPPVAQTRVSTPFVQAITLPQVAWQVSDAGQPSPGHQQAVQTAQLDRPSQPSAQTTLELAPPDFDSLSFQHRAQAAAQPLTCLQQRALQQAGCERGLPLSPDVLQPQINPPKLPPTAAQRPPSLPPPQRPHQQQPRPQQQAQPGCERFLELLAPRRASTWPRARQKFRHFVVYDLEATCSRARDLFPVEIIEIACVVIDAGDGSGPPAVAAQWQSFVRPTEHPRLTEFCTDLTGITQASKGHCTTCFLACYGILQLR